MEKISYKVSGLDCAEEISLLKKVVGSAKGIKELQFNLMQAKMDVFYDPIAISPTEIASLIATTGMQPSPWKKKEGEKILNSWKDSRLLLTLLSGLFLCFGVVFDFFFPIKVFKILFISKFYQVNFVGLINMIFNKSVFCWPYS